MAYRVSDPVACDFVSRLCLLVSSIPYCKGEQRIVFFSGLTISLEDLLQRASDRLRHRS